LIGLDKTFLCEGKIALKSGYDEITDEIISKLKFHNERTKTEGI